VHDAFRRAFARNREGWSGFFWDAFVGLGVNGIDGDYVEFGSEGANTLPLAYEAISGIGQSRHLWAFDSFAGLPAAAHERDEHPQWTPGIGLGEEAFRATVAERGVPQEAYTTVAGYYERTLPPLGTDGPPTDIALAYVDCNMYSSTTAVLAFLASRLKHGMIVAFDDYYCWSSVGPSGERAALIEFERSHPEWHFLPFARFNWAGLAFAVEDASTLP
jgi:O-methyltransferase